MKSRKIFPFVAIVSAMFIFGCSSTPPPKTPVIGTPGPGPMTRLEQYVWNGVRDWQGVPYKWGGNDAWGVDCSGFAKIIYRDIFNIDLPRTTKDQVHVGISVPDAYLRAGDLVFFRESADSRHVGIYLRNRMFIHASKSRGGVVVSRLDAPHWQRIYWTSRRVLPFRVLESRR